MKYKGFWLSHAPIHSDHLSGSHNIHGHLHSNSVYEIVDINGFATPIKDQRYINVSVEQLDGKPISFEDIKRKLISLT